MLSPVQLALIAASVSFYAQVIDGLGPSFEELVAAAKTAQQSGEYKVAADKYSAILKLRPDYTEARFNRGLMLHLAGEYSEAAANLKKVLQKDPNSFPSNLMVGVELLRMQQPEAAIAFLERARKLRPQGEQVALNLAQAELLAGHFDPAYLQFADLVRKEPGNSEAWYGLGMSSLGEMRLSLEQLSLHAKSSVYTKILLAGSYAERGYWKQADEIYVGLLALSEPKCIPSSLGFLRLREGDAASAARLFRQDLKQGCSAAAALLNRPVAAARGSVPDPAGMSSLKATGLEPESGVMPQPVWQYENCKEHASLQPVQPTHNQVNLWLHSIACADQEQSYERALNIVRSRLAVAPQDSAALYWKVRGTRKLAYSALAQVAKINPDSIQLHSLLGHILLDQEKLQAAENEYKKVLDRDPSAMEAHMGLAMAEYRSRDVGNAVPELQRVLSLAPRDSKANYLLGSILVYELQYNDAKAYLIHAEQSARPDEVVPIHARLAEAYAETGDLGRAIQQLQPCLSADPDGHYHYRISLLYKKSGNERAAKAALRRYSELRNTGQAAGITADVQ